MNKTLMSYRPFSVLLQGFIGDNIIIIKSKNGKNDEVVNLISKYAKRIGYNVSQLCYENITNTKGKDCIANAIIKLLSKKSFQIPRYFVGIRGTKYSVVNVYKVENSILFMFNHSTKRWERYKWKQYN